MLRQSRQQPPLTWTADLVIWRAQRSPGILRRLSGVLDESYNPGQLVTARGLLRLLLPVS